MDLNAGLVFGRPENSPDVLDDIPLEPNREGEEQRVERRAVEALADAAAAVDERELPLQATV